MDFLVNLVFLALDLYIYMLIAAVVLSWLTAFGVVNPDHQVIRKINQFLRRVIEPVLHHIRRVIPPIGGIDISPIIVIIAISLIKNLIVRLVY